MRTRTADVEEAEENAHREPPTDTDALVVVREFREGTGDGLDVELGPGETITYEQGDALPPELWNRVWRPFSNGRLVAVDSEGELHREVVHGQTPRQRRRYEEDRDEALHISTAGEGWRPGSSDAATPDGGGE